MCQDKNAAGRKPSHFLSVLLAAAIVACAITANASELLHLTFKGQVGWWIISFVVVLAGGNYAAARIRAWWQCSRGTK